MADYWDKAYGPAAGIMEKYWMEVDAAFINLKTEAGSIHALHHVYTPRGSRPSTAISPRPSVSPRVPKATPTG